MVGIVVTGHGNFASGLISALNLIVGEQKELIGVDFIDGESTEDLEKNIENAINNFENEILVLTDLAGASPFRTAANLSLKITEKDIKVIAGTNLGMLLEVALTRGDRSSLELLDMAFEVGNSSIKKFEIKSKEIIEEVDGI